MRLVELPDEMANQLSAAAKLALLLREMEADLGLSELTQEEREILYSVKAQTSSAGSPEFEADAIRDELISAGRMTRSTFFRALRRLKEGGRIRSVDGSRRNLYVLSE